MLKPWLCFSNIDILTDSQSGISLKEKSINHRNKHIDITYYFVKDMVMNKTFKHLYMLKSDSVADMLTKPSARVKFEQLQNKNRLEPPLKSKKSQSKRNVENDEDSATNDKTLLNSDRSCVSLSVQK